MEECSPALWSQSTPFTPQMQTRQEKQLQISHTMLLYSKQSLTASYGQACGPASLTNSFSDILAGLLSEWKKQREPVYIASWFHGFGLCSHGSHLFNHATGVQGLMWKEVLLQVYGKVVHDSYWGSKMCILLFWRSSLNMVVELLIMRRRRGQLISSGY